jgi:hypothetical protein
VSAWSTAARVVAAAELEAASAEAIKRAELLVGKDDEVEVEEVRVPVARAPAQPMRLVVVEHFYPSMIDFGDQACSVVEIRQVSKLDARKIVYDLRGEVANVMPERSAQLLERELEIPAVGRVRLVPGVTFLVVEPVRWNDVRFFLVRMLADGDGCVY